MLAPQPNGFTTVPRLTANLLDPLVSPHCSLSPPPRYCTQLHHHVNQTFTFINSLR
jgi:hypothetical protein